MKNFFKILRVITLITVISFCFIACGNFFSTDTSVGDPDSDGTGGNNNSNDNPRDNAKTVSVGYSSSHTIGSTGEHWFKFTGTGEPVIFETSGNVVDTDISIFEGDSIGGSGDNNSGEGSNALLTKSTTSGTTYYIRIRPQSGTSGTYIFMVKAPAFNIRTNPISVMVGNSSSHTISSDGTHWFKFTGTGNRVFFETEGNVVNTNIRIYIGDSTSYTYNEDKGVNFITVLGTTYYIRITGNSGTYLFKLRNGAGDGSSRYNAKEVTKGYSTSHSISYNGENWFIYQGTGEPVTFETSGNVVDTDISIFVGDSTVSRYGDYDDNDGEGSNALCTKSTISGTTYYVKITPQSGTSGTYTFMVR